MKKNIEWVISEIEERIERITSRKEATPYNEGVERGLGISLFLINQLGKTEVLDELVAYKDGYKNGIELMEVMNMEFKNGELISREQPCEHVERLKKEIGIKKEKR